jgi:hypothetical protein
MNAPNEPPFSPRPSARALLLDYLSVARPLPGLSPEERATWARRVAAARRSLKAARRLRTGDARSALTLLREAALELWPPWREEEERQGVITAQTASARARLDWATSPLPASELDALDQPELEVIGDELDSALELLLENAKRRAQSEREARLRALGRRVYLAGSLLALLAFVVLTAGGYRFLSRDKNLALGAKVTASPTAWNTAAKNVVDGYRYGQLGYHSQQERDPWLMVDLGRKHDIKRVVAFGRGDCCFDQSIPLVVQVSDDGEHFKEIGERKLPFTHFKPWALELSKPVKARYVRFQARKMGFLVLSEVEIYGPR